MRDSLTSTFRTEGSLQVEDLLTFQGMHGSGVLRARTSETYCYYYCT